MLLSQHEPLVGVLDRLHTSHERWARVARFILVGATGIAVNSVALYAAVEAFGIHYLTGVFIATQASTAWNFVLSERWVFQSDGRQWNLRSRYGQFWLLNNSFLLLRAPIIWFLTDVASVHFVLSNLISLVAILVVRYSVAEKFIWAPKAEGPVVNLDGSAQLVSPASKNGSARRDSTGSMGIVRRTLSRVSAPQNRAFLAGSLTIFAVGLFLRVVYLMELGFNSDEAVYAGQAASIAGDEAFLPYFPIFRAHPLLFQTLISIPYQYGVSPLVGRLASVAFGLATVWILYLAGRTLYSRRVGAIAALLLATMPYHVIVTRQVLLDGPMTFFSTLSLLLVAKFGVTERMPWLYAAFGAMGLTFLSKETGILLFGAIYVFVAIFGHVRIHNIVIASLVFVAVVLPYPLSIAFSGRSSTGEQFLAWQLLRRANHPWNFYAVTVPPAMGWLVLVAATASLWYLSHRWGWQETVLMSWILVPVVFFQLWPVKGFQYLLPVAPPMLLLASRGMSELWDRRIDWRGLNVGPKLGKIAVALVALSLFVPSWSLVQPSSGSTEFLAGSGGVPGGREAGEWIDENVPVGGEILTLGPSMANIVQFYGHRKAHGLSVSPNPLHRNPVYEPVNNPDLRIRSNDIQYIVWDSFSASRSDFFSASILRFVERYHGRVVHTEYVSVQTDEGEWVDKPVIVIYELRP